MSVCAVTFRGKTYPTLPALLRAIGSPLKRGTVSARLRGGWPIEQAATVPVTATRSTTGFVYMITQHRTGFKYIGITTVDVENRWLHHVFNAQRGKHALAVAIASDGPNGFTVETLETGVPSGELGDRERALIVAHNSLVPHGLNANKGGTMGGGKRTGFYDRADEIAERTGVCIHTARVWARDGSEPESGVARVYRRHGLTGTREFRQWHGRGQVGGLCAEWRDFDTYRVDIKRFAPNNERLYRRDTALPWGPNNIRL